VTFRPAADRYDRMTYARSGRSGLLLPRIALGLWWNFGSAAPFEAARAMVRRAFDLGITHFDLANNYGPPPGSAEEIFGRLLATELGGFRDELVISTKAGYRMWPGPYGEWGSRKYLLASLDASLRRMGLDHVDIFYSHRFDPATPLEETMGALAAAVRSGKAFYVGISSYPPEATRRAADILRGLGTPCLIHQPRYSLLDRTPEDGLLDAVAAEGMGCAVFSPLAQGLLTDGFARGSATNRASRPAVDDATLATLEGLAALAARRGESLSRMALAFVLRDARVTTAVIGASRPGQIEEAVAALDAPPFTADDIAAIDDLTGRTGTAV
jgi:L-glyceraldehyde 3-phosphate reductase